MFTKSHEDLARKLCDTRTATRSEMDQLRAKLRDKRQELHDCEFNRLQREVQAAAAAVDAARKRHDAELARLQAAVIESCPAAAIIEQLRSTALARAEMLRSRWDEPTGRFAHPEAIKVARQRAEARDAELRAWTALYLGLPRLYADPAPFTSLAALIDEHADVLPELRHYRVEAPPYEEELASV